jgi:hypothetical protein
MKKNIIIAITAIALMFAAHTAPAQHPHNPLIQTAILLDTSNSMDGLIGQAKTQLWKIVNEFIEAEKNGLRPSLEIALYEYGNDNLSAEAGYIRQVLPLTRDLDRVSQELFALTTKGGSEYCGQVIDEASRYLEWSNVEDDLKLIFIAGNEPFTQGPVDYHQSLKGAIARGITVNTIYCGTEMGGIEGKWKDGALLADGHYFSINQNKASIYVETPQDKKLAELGRELNETYIGYGSNSRVFSSNQAVQDKNAQMSSMESAVNRAVFKNSVQYRNDAWDLVDALDIGTKKLSEIDAKDLPENMQKMTPEEQKAYIESKREQRNQIKKEITRLTNERKAYLAEKAKESAEEKNDTLDSAIVETIQSIIADKNFQFE